MDKNKLESLVRKYIKNIESAGISVGSVYVFGSYAKGATTSSSDIDVCVASPEFGRDRASERVTLMRLREGVSDLIEPHPVSDIDMRDKLDPFVREILRTGIKIV